jgi:hypothetical protein
MDLIYELSACDAVMGRRRGGLRGVTPALQGFTRNTDLLASFALKIYPI